MPKNPLKEACIVSLREAIAAETNGVHQLELCSHIELDGLTPDIELVKQVLSHVSIPVKVMIRPRGGNFTYNAEDKKQIIADIETMKAAGVKHFVYGSIANGSLDIEDISHVLRHIAQNDYEIASLTIHKAIDSCLSLIHI